MTYAVRASLLAVVLTATALAQQGTIEPSSKSVHPLAAKEEMIRDRFQRFQDRLYRLSEELAEREPENAQRLARALERPASWASPTNWTISSDCSKTPPPCISPSINRTTGWGRRCPPEHSPGT